MSQVVRKIGAYEVDRGARLAQTLQQRYEALVAREEQVRPFELRLPDRSSRLIGQGEPIFAIGVVNDRGWRALASFDELSVAEAYLNGDLDLDGDMLQTFRYRAVLTDRRPLRYLFVTYLIPFFTGQVASDKRWIKSHYDIDPEFFLLWLDKKLRGYSHAFFEDEAEPLEVGMERKFRYAFKACGIRPGERVLDIGGGWGSFCEFAGKQGVRVTSLTISNESEKYITDLIRREQLNCQVINEHFLEYSCNEPFDAIVNLGVTEHLPDYRRTLRQYQRLLKPGRRVYLDAYSGDWHGMPSFITKWVYEGNTSPLNLPKFFTELARTPFELIQIENDRHNYYLTCKKWAENLEAARDTVISRWGQQLYRRFYLYLWSAANSFLTGTLSAHHVVMELPKDRPSVSLSPRVRQ